MINKFQHDFKFGCLNNFSRAASVIYEANKWNAYGEIRKEEVWMNYKVIPGYSTVSFDYCDNKNFKKFYYNFNKILLQFFLG